jgi:hypothetical protein
MPFGPGKNKQVSELTDDEVCWYGAVLTKEPFKSAALAAVTKRGLGALLAKKVAKEAVKNAAAQESAAADDITAIGEVATVNELAAKAFARRAHNNAYWLSGTAFSVKCPHCEKDVALRVGSGAGE